MTRRLIAAPLVVATLMTAVPAGTAEAQIAGRLQLRHTYTNYEDDARQDTSIFTAERIRISTKGKLLEDFSYEFQADFGKGSASLKDALISFAPADGLTLKSGQFKVAFDRQQLVSSGRQTFVDRNIASRRFGYGRDIGAQLSGTFGGGLLLWNAGIFNGEGEGKSNQNNGHLAVARLSLNPLGAFGLAESDIKSSPSGLAFIDLGLAMASDMGNSKDDQRTIVAGAGYRISGLDVRGEYFTRTFSPDGGTEVTSGGFYGQGGYMIVPETWEIAARFAQVDPDSDVDTNEKTEVMLGVNRFLKKGGHSMKFTADAARLHDAVTEQTDLRVRMQLQLVF